MWWEAGTQGRSALSQGDMDLLGPCRSRASVWGQGAGQRVHHAIPCLNRVMCVHDGEDPSLECSGPLDALLAILPSATSRTVHLSPLGNTGQDLGASNNCNPQCPHGAPE